MILKKLTTYGLRKGNPIQLVTLLICILGCNTTQTKSQGNDWTGSEWVQLEQENIKLRLPQQFKRSSRYRIKSDLPTIAKDSIQLRLVQNALEALEFQDSEVDVFVDTTKLYRMIIICNTARIDFTKSDASILKKHLQASNENSALYNQSLEYSEIKASMKENGNHRLARFTTQIQNTVEDSRVFNSIYYLTGNAYSLIIYEFSGDEESIEKYLWTTKT